MKQPHAAVSIHATGLSFVIPVYNESEVLPLLIPRLDTLCENLEISCEIIFVDDGSRDTSAQQILEAAETRPYYKLIRLSRNFGHQIAISAGIDRAEGDAVIVMDADLQDPPELVQEMIGMWRQGYQIVHARRKSRNEDNWLKKASAKAFYRFLDKLSEVPIPVDVGDFRLMDRTVVKAFRAMPERDRYLRGMIAWLGFRQGFVDYDRPAREAGQTKYSLSKMFRLASNGLISFSDAPLRFAVWIGIIISALALIYGIYIVMLGLFSDQLVEGWASTTALLSFLIGISLTMNGIIGLYVGRVHTQTKQRPLYFVSEEIGFQFTERGQEEDRIRELA